MPVRKNSQQFFLLLFMLLFGCSPYMATYSQVAYEQAISLKVDSLQLMDRATEPYVSHEAEARDLMIRIEKAYEYAKGRPRNEITTQQWKILKSPDRKLLGGFMQDWKKNETLRLGYIREIKGVISDAFDTIIGLESKKIKSSDVQ